MYDAYMNEVKPQLEWKFGELLDREKVKVSHLYEEVNKGREGRGISRNALYRWAKETPDRLDLGVLAHALVALSKLTGKNFSISDVMELQNDRGLELAHECARILFQAEEELTEELNRSSEITRGAPLKDQGAIKALTNSLFTDSTDSPHVKAFSFAKQHGISKATPLLKAIGFLNLVHWDLATYRAPAEDVLKRMKHVMLAYSKTEDLTRVPSTKKNFIRDLRKAAAEGLIVALKKTGTARDPSESDISELYDFLDEHYLSRRGEIM